MHVDVIRGMENFERYRSNWEAVYSADPEAQYFLSWTFLSSYMMRFKDAWFVLAARNGPPGSAYVGFFPLRTRGKLNQKTGLVTNEVHMAGSYAADYSGILAEPAHQRAAIFAMARQLRQMNWAKIHIENLRMSDRRRKYLFEALGDPRLKVTPLSRYNVLDKVDNAICPILDLPDSFDGYLERQVGSSTRQKIRRYMRKVESSDTLRITEVSAETLNRDVEALLNLWRARWAERKGEKTPAIISSNRALMKAAFASGTFKLPLLWDGDKVVGALAYFLDHTKKQMLFHMAGRDESYDAVPSGLVLHAYAIRWGIENGYRSYDFMRGDEAYKFSFGPRVVNIHTFVVQTVSRRNLGEVIDPRWIPSAFEQASRLHASAQYAKAENAYRQIIASDAQHAGALYGIGQIFAQRGALGEAIGVYRRLVALTPESVKAWLRLALALQSDKQHEAAADTFRKVLEIDPDIAQARYSLARNLAFANRVPEALKFYQELLSCSDAEIRFKAHKQIAELRSQQAVVLVDQAFTKALQGSTRARLKSAAHSLLPVS